MSDTENDIQGRVLVVDDDQDLLTLLSMRLTTVGYTVTTASDGHEALAQVAASRPDVVVTDLRMEGMDGMALFDVLQEEQPGLPVIILTAHGTIPEAVEATRQGVFSFLTKPFDGKELLAAVGEAIRFSPAGGESSTEADGGNWSEGIITRSRAMENVLAEARLVADSEANVFILGQSGSGKELLARAIHRASRRARQPFVAINCAAMPENLLESELFGYRRGAFTGANRDHKGLFQAADGGTLFLDEVGDMPLSFQAKLLRVLQEKCVRPVGATEDIPVDVRIVSATHQNLEDALQDGRFREDLYYRLNVVQLELPPLQDRREDIPLLASHFLNQIAEKTDRRVKTFAPDAMELLVTAPWPGNVRQLLNVVEHCVALSTTPVVSRSLVEKALRDQPEEPSSFAEARQRFERDYLAQLLRATEGNVSQAARIAKRNRTEFYKLLRRHRLNAADFKSASLEQ